MLSAHADVFAEYLIRSEDIAESLGALQESIASNVAYTTEQPLLKEVTRLCIEGLYHRLGYEETRLLILEAEAIWRADRVRDGLPVPEPMT